jgi:hypothetical protein
MLRRSSGSQTMRALVKIQQIQFENFRSFGSFQLGITTPSMLIIAENGGGKTSLLLGIARALGRDLRFTSADFGDLTLPIELTVTLGDLSAADRGVFANHVDFTGGGPTLQVRARAVWNAFAEEVEVEHGYPRTLGSRSRREERDALPLQWLSAERSVGRLLQFGLPDNVMGGLLASLPIQASLDAAINEIQAASGGLSDDPSLARLLDDARDELLSLLPEVGLKPFSMGVSALTPRDFLKQFELIVQHLGEPIAVPRQSSGLAQMALFAFELMLARRVPGSILLVDEPEISLHPQSQRALMKALGQLDAQLFVATHSANLLDRADPRRVVRLRRVGSTVELARPSGLTDEDARRLARFTSPQTAEAFFARSVILVEGMSDQIVLEALAERRSRNLDAEGVAIVPMGGAGSIGAFLDLFGSAGFRVGLAGLCDDAEMPVFASALERAGMATTPSRTDMEALGFFVCVADLEDELIRALGTTKVEQLVDSRGDLGAFRVFQGQAKYAPLALDQQLRAFISKGRKIEYGPLLVDALDLTQVPAVLDGVLASV